MMGNQLIPRLIACCLVRRAEEICEFDWERLRQAASADGYTLANLPRSRIHGER